MKARSQLIVLRAEVFKDDDGTERRYSPYPPANWPKLLLNKAAVSVPLPDRMKSLPVSEKGFSIPWFVSWIDDKPDFRAVSPYKVAYALQRNICWICGGTLGRYKTFAIGPMCCINRTTAEPPTHLDCAIYATKVCPFMVNPKAGRNYNNLPGGEQASAPGIMIQRNPGAMAIWTTETWKAFNVDNGFLVELGKPSSEVKWICEGRPATFAEVYESVYTGLPTLMGAAAQDGYEAFTGLIQMVREAFEVFPK